MSLRIIGGSCKGKKLKSLRGLKTRPTAGRTREAVFNIISQHIPNAMVLDLFAGTGAFGLEALSRGAATAVFIDKDRSALSIIEKNIASCYMEQRSRIIGWDIVKNIKCIENARPPFDVVFMDPPYEKGFVERALKQLPPANALADGALIIAEHSRNEVLPQAIAGLDLIRQRRYGRSMVSVFGVHPGTG